MTISIKALVALIYTAFALDSAVKIDLGAQIHIGICAILAVNLISILSKPKAVITPIVKDYSFTVFILYSALNGLYFNQPGFISILIYLLIALNILIYAQTTYRLTGRRLFFTFQIIMIATGLGQYLAYKIFGFQLSFIQSDHYQKGSSVSHRLRGLFIEPNWFAIAFSFNTLLLFGSDAISFAKKHKLIFLLTCLVMILNGSLTTTGIIVAIYSIPIIKKNPVKGIISTLLMLALLAGVLAFRDSINQKSAGESALNHFSRIAPIVRVFEFFSANEYRDIFFGHGLGSWGTLAVGNRLSVLVYEQDPSARDGSETPVILFELGLLGLILITLDSIRVFRLCRRDQLHIKGGVILFVACFALYPTLKFWMYMPYYFYMRAAVYANKPIQTNS